MKHGKRTQNEEVAAADPESRITHGYAYWSRFIAYHGYNRWFGSRKNQSKFVYRRALRHLRSGKIAIDCGANVGKISRVFAEKGATVYAFEPDPYAFQRLKEAVSGYPNVTIFQAAVGPENGTIRLYRHEDFESDPERRSQSSSIFSDKNSASSESPIEVEMIDICEFVKGIGKRISILKMDIEGAEVAVIESLIKRGTIDKIDLLLAEPHDDRIPSIFERTQQLKTKILKSYPKKIYLDWK